MTNLKTNLFCIVCATFMLSACDFETEKIRGQAIIVDNLNDKNPLEGVYIELMYTKDEGYTYTYLYSVTTDKNGYFKIDTEYKNGLFSFDSWLVTNVYSDEEYSDTLGTFSFHKADGYKTIFLDTFSLAHKVWFIPKIRYLGGYQPDEITIDFYNCALVDCSQKIMTYSGSVNLNQEFTPVQIKMSMNAQHWFSSGTSSLARGSLKKDSKEIGFGYFKLEKTKHTVEGDTLFLYFDAEKTN